MNLKDAAQHMKGHLLQPEAGVSCFSGVSTDSRTIVGGDLFFALSGPNFDGHAYINAVEKAGACAAVVAQNYKERMTDSPTICLIVVDDVLLSLGYLAKAWRMQFANSLKVCAVTGSSGKTTVKEMLAAIFQQAGNTLATVGNFNNHIGVPLTLLRLQAEHEYAVIELGASGMGEIGYTAELVQAQVALVNNVAGAHIEGFGSLDNTAAGKGEIYKALAEDGVAVINADDYYADYWRELCGERRQISFSTQADAEVRLIKREPTDNGHWKCTVALGETDFDVNLPLLGEHNIRNLLAAIACAQPFGVTTQQIVQGVASLKPVAGRMAPHRIGDVIVVDDSYNANESSVQAAMDFLAATPAQTKLFVLGDLAELGDESSAIHERLGIYAKNLRFNGLIGVGKKIQGAVQAFGPGAHQIKEHSAAVDLIVQKIEGSTCIVVKGSRSSAMEKVVNPLIQQLSQRSGAATMEQE